MIFVHGDPLITLLKKAPEGVSKEEAWNHTNGSRFLTVTKEKNDRLKGTDFYEKLSDVPIIKFGHIIAADVLWSDDLGYVVCELNTCPGLTIEDNLERVVNHVQGHHQLR